MSKKFILLFAIIMTAYAPNVIAAPSVRHLGNGAPSLTTKKSNVAVPKQTETKSSPVITAKAASVPVLKSTTKADSSRVSSIGHAIKTVSTPKNTTPSVQPTTPGATTQELGAIITRIEALEAQAPNTITEVVESNTGNYVTEVAVEGNKLNVVKTKSLYAPIINESNNNITGNAEIWIVK